MRTILQLWRMTCYEWFDAIRSRRAVVAILLCTAISVFAMYWLISLLGRLEKELTTVLQLPENSRVGVVSEIVWQSKVFQRVVRQAFQNDAVFQDVSGLHPVSLIYGWLAFSYLPWLTVLISSARIPEEVGGGSVRYVLFRSSRGVWLLGKFFGQLSLLGTAALFGGAAAWLTARYRIGEGASFALFGGLLLWAVKGWILSIPYAGMVMGASLFTRSAGKALIAGVLVLTVCFVLNAMLLTVRDFEGWRCVLPPLASLLPVEYQPCLWRKIGVPFFTGAAALVMLGFFYLGIGYAFFKNKDV